ncbi:MAG: BtrH N-terminal domain-containing protein [Prevotellaceae bacterium]|jgi:hypothetical protein|nr:BtrH N-terminal domain-containing protein [Prevotellaceae bacterium]
MKPFEHKPAAHCETGVTANLLNFHGIKISEPMALGLGAGLFFSHMPFVTLHGMAVTSFRPLPGQIFSRVTKALGVKVKKRRFLNRDRSMRALDGLLARGLPAGVLVGVFHLPYFPKEYRFHFNAHNIAVTGKENGRYIISDPVLMHKETIGYEALKRCRYAKGTYPPYGKMYWIDRVKTQHPDLPRAIVHAIKLNCRRMLDIPVPFFGVRGIGMLAKRMRRWEQRFGSGRAALNLAQIVRMLEEIGTGGAGFRFMYAAFLQEAAGILGNPAFKTHALRMTEAGDRWRDFAAEAGRKFKNRGENICSYDELADKLVKIAGMEEALFRALRRAVKEYKQQPPQHSKTPCKPQ